MKRSLLWKLVGAMAACSLALGSPALGAASGYRVDVGGLPADAGPQAFTATSATSAIALRFSTPTSPTWNCTRALVPSAPVSTANHSPAKPISDVVSIRGMQWLGCTMNGTALKLTTTGSWTFRPSGGVSASAADVVTGQLEGVQFQMSASNPNICSFTVSGQADVRFDESTQTLTFDEMGADKSLKMDYVRGCGGMFAAGPALSLKTSMKVTVAGGRLINIKP